MKYPIFCYYKDKDRFWFRIFGIGLHFKNMKHHLPLFSERYGYSKYVKIGNWMIKFLPK